MGKDLTALNVANLLKAGTLGRHRASENLYLQVRGKGSGSWLFRYTLDSRAGVSKTGKAKRTGAHWMGLGKANRLSLAEARAKARQCAQLLDAGTNPLDAKRQRKTAERIEAAKNRTFGEC